jgi:hypothetical protein
MENIDFLGERIAKLGSEGNTCSIVDALKVDLLHLKN